MKLTQAHLIAAMVVVALWTSGPTVAGADDFGLLIASQGPDSDDEGAAENQANAPAFDGQAPLEAQTPAPIIDDPQTIDEPDSDLIREIQSQQGLFPRVQEGRFVMPDLTIMTTATEQIGNGRTPESFREKEPADVIPLPESAEQRGLSESWSFAQWEAPNTFSFPLYFEDRMAERHGHDRWGHLQPVASGVRFFTTVPMLPYLMTINGPCDCEYKLGHYRAGSCAPVMIQRPPLERRAVVAEALALGGAIAILP